jgi:4-amino-4-deoxy-L-arabinose transferase-like glycosyltransferase
VEEKVMLTSKSTRNMVRLVSSLPWGLIVPGLGIILLIGLGFYHQPYYPKTWIDEGFVLQGAINLVRYGEYGMQSVEGMRILDQPLIANGPGVVMPIAAVFRVFGIGLLQARIVMVVIMVLTAILYFWVARRLNNIMAAYVATFLLLSIPGEGFLLYGRHALGNVPALAYFLLGYGLWLTALERYDYYTPLGAGLLFGLAAITKGQYLLILPVWFAVFMFDFFYLKRIGVRRITAILVGMGIILVAWYAMQILLVGWDSVSMHFGRVGSSSAVTVAAFELSKVPSNVWYLFRSGFVLVVLPGFFYILWSCRLPNRKTAQQIFLVMFIVVWLVWYLFASVGWPRYAFDPYVIGLLFTSKAIFDGFRYLQVQLDLGRHDFLIKPKNLLILLFIGMISAAGIWGFSQQVQAVLAEPDRSPQVFAKYLQANVPSEMVIESWEWEIDALTLLTYHHPTNDWVDMMTAVLQFNAPPVAVYDFSVYQPDYLIDGPFSKWTGLYRPHLAANCCTLVMSVGQYDLYTVNPALP